MFGPELIDAFREFKSIWDPQWKMNPGKVVDPYPITSNLRLGTDYRPPQVETHFAFPDDHGSFAHATTRCVGIGKCRRTDPGGDVMCPSYQVTLRGEAHDARPRADPLGDAERRRARAVALARGVRGARPLPVVQGLHARLPRQRRHADAQGRVPVAPLQAAPATARGVRVRPDRQDGAPRVEAARARERVHAHAGRRSCSPARIPSASSRRSRREPCATGSARGRSRPTTGKKVILWADTFNNHFHPEVGVAAVDALETAGYHVTIPRAHLCCGRPLYDYGMLDLAQRYLDRVLGTLRDEIRAGTPIVGIEPSCIAVLKDEAPKLMPNDEDVKRLCKQSFHLAEFLCREGYEPPQLEGRALVHGHCHEKATSGFEPLQQLLEKMGLEVESSNGGCCGMAGAWGYEKGHYDVSIACGERALLPGGATRRRRRARRHRRLLVQDADRAGNGTARAPSRRGVAPRARPHGRGAAADGVDARRSSRRSRRRSGRGRRRRPSASRALARPPRAGRARRAAACPSGTATRARARSIQIASSPASFAPTTSHACAAISVIARGSTPSRSAACR